MTRLKCHLCGAAGAAPHTPDGLPFPMCSPCFAAYEASSADGRDKMINDAESRPIMSTSPCSCGLTPKEFDYTGRFSCPDCYEHFADEMRTVVIPYHGSDFHTGKRPKSNPEERMKVLRLNYAKALELENYEAAGVLLAEIKSLGGVPTPPATSSGR